MGAILLPQRHLIQPQYTTELDPAWKKVTAFASITGLPGSMDMVSRSSPAEGATVARRGSQKGRASYTGSVAQGLVWASLKPVPSTFTTGISFLVFANPAAQAAQQRVFFLGDETAAGGSFNQASFQFNCNKGGTPTSGLFSAFEYNFGFQGTGESTAGAVDGNWHVFIATRPAGFGSFTLYRDGLDVTSSGGSANGVPLNDGCRLHVNPGATIGYTGDLVLAAAFNTQLDVTQVRKLSNNPWQLFKAPARRIWAVASSDVTLSLSGQSLTSARGSLTPNNSVSLSGQSVTSARGTLSPSVGSTVALTGLGLTSARGTLSPALSITLSGQALTGTRGTFIPATQIALTGQSLASAKGTLNVSGTASAALTGQSLTAGQGTLSPSSSSSVALTGQTTTAAYGALSPANAVTLSGQYVTSAQGSVAVSTAIALNGQSFTIGQGSLAIVGDVSIQLSGLQLSIDVGDLAASTGALSSIVERTAIFRATVARSTKFQRSKSVTVRFN